MAIIPRRVSAYIFNAVFNYQTRIQPARQTHQHEVLSWRHLPNLSLFLTCLSRFFCFPTCCDFHDMRSCYFRPDRKKIFYPWINFFIQAVWHVILHFFRHSGNAFTRLAHPKPYCGSWQWTVQGDDLHLRRTFEDSATFCPSIVSLPFAQHFLITCWSSSRLIGWTEMQSDISLHAFGLLHVLQRITNCSNASKRLTILFYDFRECIYTQHLLISGKMLNRKMAPKSRSIRRL